MTLKVIDGDELPNVAGTKISVPPVAERVLRRPHLTGRLEEGAASSLLTVSAPAGAGKTTLLAEWAAGRRGRTAWLSLDPVDDRDSRFWRHFAAAVEHATGEPATAWMRHKLKSVDTPADDIAVAVAGALDRVRGRLAMVIDDFHLIESEPLRAAITTLAARMPIGKCLVLAGRTDPGVWLPRAGRRAAVRLQPQDLRFSAEESIAVLSSAWDVQASEKTASILVTRTDGWAAGLQLAALALRLSDDPETVVREFTGAHRFVFDYFSDEVLARVDERLLVFMRRCSVLDELSPGLCDAVAGMADAAALLSAAERANLFLQPLDAKGQWFRLHHLFRDLLRARLERDEPEIVAELHRRAGEWCEKNRRYDRAVRHAAELGDWDWVTRLADPHLESAIAEGDLLTVDGWLSELPDAVVLTDTRLCLAKAAIEWHRYRFDAVEDLLDHAERAIGATAADRRYPTHGGTVADPRAAIATLRAEIAGARRDSVRERQFARIALGHLGPDEHRPRFWLEGMTVSALWHEGRMAEAAAGFADMAGAAAGDPHHELLRLRSLASARLYIGELDAARASLEEGLSLATEHGTEARGHECIIRHLLGRLFYECDDLDRARPHAERALALARELVESWSLVLALEGLAWITLAEGDTEEALRLMDEACEGVDGVGEIWPTEARRAKLQMAADRPEPALAWARRQGLPDEDEFGFANESRNLALSWALLVEGRAEVALPLLDRLGAEAETGGRRWTLLEVRMLEALAARAGGQEDAAYRPLAEALALAESQGRVRVFVEAGQPMAELLRSAVRSSRWRLASPPRRFASGILQAFPSPSDRSGVDPLTERESEVLALVAAGYRNKEIAERLSISLDTVKTHTRHIYTKLGASGRTAVLRRAHELGLIR